MTPTASNRGGSLGHRLSAGLIACAVGATVVAATPAAAAPALPAPDAAASVTAAPAGRWLVTATDGSYPALLAELRAGSVDVVHELSSLGVVVVDAPASAVGALARSPLVAATTPDTGLALQASTYDARSDVNSMYNVTSTMGARAQWLKPNGQEFVTGKGVDVAVLDSGVSPVPGLDTPGKLVHGPDLSFDSQSPAFRQLDGFGHGTHMAGIIAGRDAGVPLTSDGGFVGMAPGARIVSVKVADAYGNTDVSQVIAGIDWVVKNRSNGLNIRVLNLSLGTPSMQSYTLDPLAHAAEVAWRKGIVVVAAAGNDGTGTGKLLNPAQDPYVLAVGATDSKGSNQTDDDVIPAFSNRGDGVRNPDLVAAGTSVQSLRVPGSYIDQQHGATGGIDDRFFRGSGTSQAAAVVSGAAALLLQREPSLTPDDVKLKLVKGTRPLPAADPQAQGAGVLDVRRSIKQSVTGSKQNWTRSKGNGSLDAARGGYVVSSEDGVALVGEQDIFSKPFTGDRHGMKQESEAAWDGGAWNTSTWTGASWSDQGWAGVSWDDVDWTGRTWAGRTWAGRTWAGDTWNGRTWADGYWNGRTWAGRTWAGRTWATGGWK